MLVERLRAIVANVIRAWQQAADSPAPAVHRAPPFPAPRRCLRFDVEAPDELPWHEAYTRADFFPLPPAAMITRRAQHSLWHDPWPGAPPKRALTRSYWIARSRGSTGSSVLELAAGDGTSLQVTGGEAAARRPRPTTIIHSVR